MGYNFGVGREAPTFTLNDTDGTAISLAQYRGDWYPILVFLAGDGAAQLGRLGAAADTFWGLRGQLVAVCPGSVDDTRALAAEAGGLVFPLLADDGAVAALYGARAKDGSPRQMAFIIDRTGKIVWSGEGEAAAKPAALLAALRQIAR